MFPLRNSAASSFLTPVNVALIITNAICFGVEVSLGPNATREIAHWALVPARIAMHRDLQAYASIVTSMFLHAGIWHLAGNMLYLAVFGAAVEERMGGPRYAYFYFLAGAASALTSVWITPASQVPIIGASGAIAGVLGAHLFLFPRARILTLIPFVIFVQTF